MEKNTVGKPRIYPLMNTICNIEYQLWLLQ